MIAAGGATVYVEPQTAELLTDSTLDAQAGPDGPGLVLTE